MQIVGVIDGIEYKFDKNLYSNLRPGLTCKLLIDAFGGVRSCERINDVVYGYLKGIKSFGMEGGRCKIFTENNRWVELDLADKILQIRLQGGFPSGNADSLKNPTTFLQKFQHFLLRYHGLTVRIQHQSAVVAKGAA